MGRILQWVWVTRLVESQYCSSFHLRYTQIKVVGHKPPIRCIGPDSLVIWFRCLHERTGFWVGIRLVPISLSSKGKKREERRVWFQKNDGRLIYYLSLRKGCEECGKESKSCASFLYYAARMIGALIGIYTAMPHVFSTLLLIPLQPIIYYIISVPFSFLFCSMQINWYFKVSSERKKKENCRCQSNT